MTDFQLRFRPFAANLGVTTNQTITPMMRAAERVPATSKEAYVVFFLTGSEVRSLSHLKQSS